MHFVSSLYPISLRNAKVNCHIPISASRIEGAGRPGDRSQLSRASVLCLALQTNPPTGCKQPSAVHNLVDGFVHNAFHLKNASLWLKPYACTRSLHKPPRIASRFEATTHHLHHSTPQLNIPLPKRRRGEATARARGRTRGAAFGRVVCNQ